MFHLVKMYLSHITILLNFKFIYNLYIVKDLFKLDEK